MRRIMGCLLVLLPALPMLGGQDKPMTPQEQYQALLKEQTDDMKAFRNAYQKARTDEEKDKVTRESYSKLTKLAQKFLELAEKNRKDPVAFDALAWIVTNMTAGVTNNPRSKAVAILLRDHVHSDKLGRVCQSLANSFYSEGIDLLLGILDRNPNQEIQAEACLALGERLSGTSQMVRLLKERPEFARRLEQAFGKEQADDLQKADAARMDAESVRYFKMFGEKHAARMKPERLVQLCQSLGSQGGMGGETLLRALLEKDTRRDVQGVACLALARSLKKRADAMPEAEDKNADSLRRQSEELFELATAKYADVKLAFRGAVGDQANGELFELRHLSIGKVAPEIEGEDADRKRFKLSDYRGKVVLLDFWGHW